MIFVYIYLILGFIYALYIFLFASDGLLAFPINMLAGPVVVLYVTYKTLRGHRIKVKF